MCKGVRNRATYIFVISSFIEEKLFEAGFEKKKLKFKIPCLKNMR